MPGVHESCAEAERTEEEDSASQERVLTPELCELGSTQSMSLLPCAYIYALTLLFCLQY